MSHNELRRPFFCQGSTFWLTPRRLTPLGDRSALGQLTTERFSAHLAHGNESNNGTWTPSLDPCFLPYPLFDGSFRQSKGVLGNPLIQMFVGQNQWSHVGVGEFTTHFRTYLSGWIGMFTGVTIWSLTHGQISLWFDLFFRWHKFPRSIRGRELVLLCARRVASWDASSNVSQGSLWEPRIFH